MSIKSNQWKEVILENHVDLLTGFPFKSQLFTDNKEDIPLVKGSNVHQGYIDWKDAKRWQFSDFNKYNKFQLEVGDVILAMDRPWIEAGLKYSWIRRNDPPSLLVQRVSRIRGINGLSTSYLRYLIGSSDFTDYIKPIATGINVPHISPDQIRRFKFLLPPLSTQQKIVGILSAYDDLIENNTRRIEILEEMARMLYREWFVKFRFPGHEAVQFVESELGLIPEGWEVKKLKEICKHINYGYTAKAKEIQEKPEEPKLLRITDIVPSIIDWNKVPYCEIEEGKIHKYLLSEGDIVIARTGATVGYAKRLHKRHQKTIFASYLVRLKVDESIVNNEYIGIIIESDEYKQFIKANMTGSAQPQANAQIMTSLSIIIPPFNLQKMFKELVTNFLDQKEILQIKNINLRKTRDLLLPRLISGEIDVENLAINTGIQQ